MRNGRRLRVLYPGVASPPEAFLQRTFDGLKREGIDVELARGASGRMPRRRPDIVHFEWNSAAIQAVDRGEYWTLPTVVSCRGTQIRVRPHVTPGYAERLRESFKRASVVHCVCETIRDEAVALGLEAAKSVVIYPGVDVREFAPSPVLATGELRLLSVGALIWTKGYEYLLSAIRLLLDRGIAARLDIIGTGNEGPRLLYTIGELGLGEAVKMHGKCSSAAVREAMQRSHIFLHSSLSEGISNAVLEAMACGVPIVTSECGGMHEAVTDGHDGFVVPMRDPRAAASAIARLAGDPELRARFGRQARYSIENRFRLEDQISQWVALYERLAHSGVTA